MTRSIACRLGRPRLTASSSSSSNANVELAAVLAGHHRVQRLVEQRAHNASAEPRRRGDTPPTADVRQRRSHRRLALSVQQPVLDQLPHRLRRAVHRQVVHAVNEALVGQCARHRTLRHHHRPGRHDLVVHRHVVRDVAAVHSHSTTTCQRCGITRAVVSAGDCHGVRCNVSGQ